MASQGAQVILVDDNNCVIGYSPYATAPADARRRDTSIFLSNDKEQVLLARRHPNKNVLPNVWGTSCAGSVERGETYRQNAYKELEEELGLTGIKLRHVGAYLFDYGENKRYSAIFHGTYNGDIKDLRLQADEVVDAKWVAHNKLAELIASSPHDFAPAVLIHSDLAMQPPPPEHATIVDEHNQIIGHALRNQRPKGTRFRLAIVVVRNSKYQVLIQKRGSVKPEWEGRWETAGGLVTYGESYESAARRELFEEIGLFDTALRPLGVHPFAMPSGIAMAAWFSTQTDWLPHQFHPDPKEVTDIRWIDSDELLTWYKKSPQDFMPSCAHFLTLL